MFDFVTVELTGAEISGLSRAAGRDLRTVWPEPKAGGRAAATLGEAELMGVLSSAREALGEPGKFTGRTQQNNAQRAAAKVYAGLKELRAARAKGGPA